MENEDDIVEVPAFVAQPEMVDGALVTENEDGSVEIDLEPVIGGMPTVDAEVHDANLAEHIDEDDLNALAATLLEGAEQDKESRAEWESMLAMGMDLMGLKIEKRSEPFEGACGIYDPLMAEAVVRWQATAMSELFPAKGPVKAEVTGIPNRTLEDQASRVEAWMNLYLTKLAPEYLEEKDQMMMWLPLVGSTFTKTYQDPTLRRPVTRFKTPHHVIVPYGATDLETCPRYTCIEPMTERQIKAAMIGGVYRNLELDEPENDGDESQVQEAVDSTQGVTNQADVYDTYKVYEVYCDLNLEGFEHPEGLPLPYVVSIDKQTQQVLAIRRNWRKGDETYTRKNGLIHWRFMPGFGFYGIGYAHLLGNSAMAATMGERNLIDAATLKNFPGGVRAKGIRFEDNNFTLSPGEFKEVDTGGQPLQNVFMPLPYGGADPVLMEMTNRVSEKARGLASTTEIAVGEGRQDAPVGTTVALMEAANLVRSGTLKRQHRALGKELKAIADLFGENLPDTPYPFPVKGGEMAIMRQDFASNVDVIPVSDPSTASSTQRMVRAEGYVRMAQQFPQQHDLRAALENYYVEIGLDAERIARMLPAPQQAPPPTPLDPLSENMNAMVNKPLVAGEYQDHDAHIAAHMPLAEQNPSLQAHIQEHMAWRVRAQVQQLIGQPLPPPGQPMPPGVENQFAALVAQAMQQLAPMYKAQPQPDPLVEAEREKTAQRMAEAELDAQTKVQVAQINAAVDETKIIADNQTKITVAAITSGDRNAG